MLTLKFTEIQRWEEGLYSIKEYLHEKAEESRHNETAAYLMFIAGIIFFVGGLLATMYSSKNLHWFLFLPYNITSNPAGLLGLTLTLCGMSLSVYGIVVGIFYSRKRAFYIQRLCEAHAPVEKSIISPKGKRKIKSRTRKDVRKRSAKSGNF
jgi:uncharacterized membrane protein